MRQACGSILMKKKRHLQVMLQQRKECVTKQGRSAWTAWIMKCRREIEVMEVKYGRSRD